MPEHTSPINKHLNMFVLDYTPSLYQSNKKEINQIRMVSQFLKNIVFSTKENGTNLIAKVFKCA